MIDGCGTVHIFAACNIATHSLKVYAKQKLNCICFCAGAKLLNKKGKCKQLVISLAGEEDVATGGARFDDVTAVDSLDWPIACARW